MANIDHFMIASDNLDRLATYFTSLTGIPVAAGGRHPAWGTHNKLIATTNSTYLELIAPDPQSDARSPLRELLEQMDDPQLHRIIAQGHASRFPAIVAAYESAGIPAEVKSMSRETTTGETLNWQLLMPAAQNDYGIFAPLFIDWGTSTHPSLSLPAAPCTVAACLAGHPDPARLRRLWDAIGFDLPLVRAAFPYFKVSLDTPRGRIDLRTAMA